jgi:hypothetical protein
MKNQNLLKQDRMLLARPKLVFKTTKRMKQQVSMSIQKKFSILFKKMNDDWNKAERIHQQIQTRKQEILLSKINSDFPKMF